MREVVPAILTSDPARLRQLAATFFGVSEWMQIDIMDGKFVSGRSVELSELLTLESRPRLDIHLMVEKPEEYIADCKKIKAERVIFHIEATAKPAEILALLAQLDTQVGIALKPNTPLEMVAPYLDQVAVVLLLGVEPGQQGQVFLPKTLDKIKALRALAPRVVIEIDGGLNAKNIQTVAEAGADVLVVGSAIVNAPNPVVAYQTLTQLV